MNKNQKGFSVIELMLVLIFLALVVFVGYYVYHSQKTSSKAASQSTTSESKLPKTSTSTDKTATKDSATQPTQAYLTIPQWSVKIPVSGALAQLQYDDITDPYGFTDSTMQFSGYSEPNVGPCKGGGIDWVQRVPTSSSTHGNTVLTKIGNYNYLDIGVQDCTAGDPTGIVQLFKQAASKMVAN